MALDLSRTIVKSFRLEKALFDVYEKIKETTTNSLKKS